jgi:hypothetical protein
VRYFFRRRIPDFERVVVIESGSRYLVEDLLPGLYESHAGKLERLDLVTCYAGKPRTFRAERGAIYRVTDYPNPAARKQLYRLLGENRYTIAGVVCSGEPIMTKWKWVLGARLPAKIFVLNENGDYFWLDYGNWRTIRHFILFRAGLSGAGAVRTLVRLAFLPFTVSYLVLYAAAVHTRAAIRSPGCLCRLGRKRQL